MNWLGYMRFLQGYTIFSNQEFLKFPYIYIEDIKGFKNIIEMDKSIKKVFLGDDFERWVNSRLWKTNIDINSVTLDFGKANCSLIYTAKRPMAIDISLRNTTDEFWLVSLVQWRYPTDEKNRKQWEDELENLIIEIKVYDYNLDLVEVRYLRNLQHWVKLFDTQEHIKDIIRPAKAKGG